ncbi:hypothetical protein [Microbacterium sp.]|uniref:hypothetical protein n=1 Tax=Microbacterium sp. TaxID=51671 RepID=UPI00273716C6|nr:hypothetical protein [Microbacterium sp.]MDP3951387.1 hypothetical protein [Microbacterium sp.]
MDTVVGVVGPRDLVDLVARICEQQSSARIKRFAYTHESEAPGIVNDHAAAVDAWLFTGIIPYAFAGDVLTRPAAYVDYTGPTLLQAFVQLLRDGHDVTKLSVDTLDGADVNAVLAESHIPTKGVHALAFRPGITSQTLVDFHRKHAKPGSVAITCVSTVYEQLNSELTILRLVPSWHSIRFAIRQLLLVTTNQNSEDSQVVLGIIETNAEMAGEHEGPSPDVIAESDSLAGVATGYGPGKSLIVTTQGQLASATDQFSSAPFLQRLAARHSEVRAGFGLGRSAAEAESLARRALARARAHGPIAAVASFRNDIDILLDAQGEPSRPGDALEKVSIGIVAARVGLSTQTVQRLHGISIEADGEALTTRDIAAKLGIQQRTARRILQRLELAGFADRAGHLSPGTSGRPLTLYHLRL